MKQFLLSFKYAFNGVSAALKQTNLRLQFVTAIVVVIAGFYFEISVIEWCVILLCISLTLSMEMMNSAVENLVNLVTTEWKPLAGKIKDIAAGAVLVSSLLAAVIGVLIFCKYIF